MSGKRQRPDPGDPLEIRSMSLEDLLTGGEEEVLRKLEACVLAAPEVFYSEEEEDKHLLITRYPEALDATLGSTEGTEYLDDELIRPELFGRDLVACVSSHSSVETRRSGRRSKIQPLGDRILVKRLDDEKEQRLGGIIIPDSAKERSQEAEVVAVGPGRLADGKRAALCVKRGDKVLIGKYSGSEVELDGEEHLILREDEILSVIS